MINIFKKYAKGSRGMLAMIQYGMAGLPMTCLKPNPVKNTEIVSLSIQETQELLSLSPYNTSTELLSRNSIPQSLTYLNYALSEAKSTFPYSLNLHNCLLNRISILQKLLSKNQDFVQTLQQLYLTTISMKGASNSASMKSLINYMIGLTIYKPERCNQVLDYLKEQREIPEYLLFFDAINDIRIKKQYQSGINKLKALPAGKHEEIVFKENNLAFMMFHSIRERHHPAQFPKHLKKQSQTILNHLITALIQAQNNPENSTQYSQQQIHQSQQLILQLEKYQQKRSKTLPTIPTRSKRILKQSNSHIIATNIAVLLFEVQRHKECYYFLKIALDRAVSQGELERVGTALILLGKYYYIQENDKWEDTFLDILKHAKTYPPHITKQALSSYSNLLVPKGRLYQAESYINQAMSIQTHDGLEGLILPGYDFSY